MVWIPSRRRNGMIHKGLMAAAGAGEIIDTSYDIANIAYSGTAGPNYQSVSPNYLESTGQSALVYDITIVNDGQGILAHGGGAGNVPSGYVQWDFAGTNNYESNSFEMFDNFKFKFGLSSVGYGEATHWVDSTTLFTAYRSFTTPFTSTMKKFTLGTAWDISSLNTTPAQSITLPATNITAEITSLKFNSTGTKFFIFTDAEVIEFHLNTAYDLTTLVDPNKVDSTNGYFCVHMNAAGDKIYFSEDLQTHAINYRTLTTGFDLNTIGTKTLVHTSANLNAMSKGFLCGIAMNEADSNYSAGELVWICTGWSVRSTVTRGVMSTPFDLTTVTWDDPLPASGAKIGLLPNEGGSAPLEFIGGGNEIMLTNANNPIAGRYLAHYELDGNGVWRKEAYEFGQQFAANSLSHYTTTEVTNPSIAADPAGVQYTRNGFVVYFYETSFGATQSIHLAYYQDNINNTLDPATSNNPISRLVTNWVKDGLNITETWSPILAQYRKNAEYDTSLRLDRRLWVLIRGPGYNNYIIRKMSSNSTQVQTNPNNWTLDTGTGNVWTVPFGAGGITTNEKIMSFTVSPNGDKFLIMTGAGNLYLFNNDAPWDLDGTITLAQTASLPLTANTMPRNAWYDQFGTRLYVLDTTGFLYEYDCGT